MDIRKVKKLIELLEESGIACDGQVAKSVGQLEKGMFDLVIFDDDLSPAQVKNLERISRSQAWGNKTYYLAEAGINEAVWLVQHDPDFINGFDIWVWAFVITFLVSPME